MPNVSRKALGEVIKRNLPSNKQHMVGSIMRKAGVDPRFSASLKGYQAKAVLKKLQSEGLLKSSARRLSEGEFGRQLQKAGAPQGPDPKAVQARKLLNIRERMVDEQKKKDAITEALSRTPAAKSGTTPASRPQAPLVGGQAISQAARNASRPGGSATSPETPEAIDPFGEE